MDAIDRFGQELVLAGRRRHARRRPLPALFGTRFARTSPRRRASAHVRVALVALALVLATAAITLAATGVILTGSPVGTARAPIATAGEGIPVAGGARLLPLRAADPAGGLPWGMRIIHTTRGLICVQIGRVYDGQLGQLGVDGAFHDDGRFHPLPTDALPDVLANAGGWMAGNCASPGDIYAGDSVGLELSAATSPRPGAGVPADRREISFGLLGVHAVSITYREGSQTRTQPVLPGLGAYLIVQRYTSGRPLGSVSETDGRDEPGNYSSPAGPNGALTAITYSYAGRSCVDRGNLRLASCGLSEVPPPRPAALPDRARAAARTPADPQPRDHERADQLPRALPSHECRRELLGDGAASAPAASPEKALSADVARGALVTIPVGGVLSDACGRAVKFTVEYVSFAGGLPQPTPLGSITIHEPPGTHPAPLPRRVVEQRDGPTRHAACTRRFISRSCPSPARRATPRSCSTRATRARSASRLPTRSPLRPPATPGPPNTPIDGFATCKAGGRPETSWSLRRNVRAHETLRTTSLGLFVLTPSCLSSEGFEVTYLNQQGPSAGAPHESVIVGTVTLSKATLPNGQNPQPTTGAGA